MTEPLRLAQYLRERCARNQYGLRYLNPEQSLLLIPWPVVPRANEESPPGFQMFHEWAELSHRRRGNSEAAELRESATQQKHRFRNALARANGIIARKDINIEGAKVYQLVDCRKTNAGPDVQLQSPFSPEDLDDFDDMSNLVNDVSPVYPTMPAVSFPTISPQHTQTTAMRENGYDQGFYPLPYESQNQVSNSGIAPAPPGPHSMSGDVGQFENIMTNGNDDFKLYDMYHTPPHPVEGSRQLQQDAQIALSAPPHIQQMHSPESQMADPSSHLQQLQPEPQMGVAGPSQSQQYPMVQQMAPPPVESQSELTINVRFRQDDACTVGVTNKFGCRVYSGKNIPDLSQLLEREHMENLMKRFRFGKEYYFGPESVQQVPLPIPDKYMKTPAQIEKTRAILANMDRGLLLALENINAASQMNIPDVFAMRLCQTRIFPCHNIGTSKSLNRMEWTKVFDGQKFCEQLQVAEQGPSEAENFPSPSFSLSLGQKPHSEERSLLFVCLTITVQRAQQLIQSKLDSAGNDICISYVNSTDLEARNLANKLTETLTL